jgi:hypothetical protein
MEGFYIIVGNGKYLCQTICLNSEWLGEERIPTRTTRDSQSRVTRIAVTGTYYKLSPVLIDATASESRMHCSVPLGIVPREKKSFIGRHAAFTSYWTHSTHSCEQDDSQLCPTNMQWKPAKWLLYHGIETRKPNQATHVNAWRQGGRRPREVTGNSTHPHLRRASDGWFRRS